MAHLTVAQVMERYGIRRPSTARRLMDEAGAFLVAGRLLVSERDLLAHEDRLRAERRHGHVAVSGSDSPRRRMATAPGSPNGSELPLDALPPGFWRPS